MLRVVNLIRNRAFLALFNASVLTLVLTVASGCSFKRHETVDDQQKLKVQIPFTFDGVIRLQVVELFSVLNLQKMKGSAAQFFIDPEVSSYNPKEALFLTGSSPQIQYVRNADGVIVPTDDLSLQLLTVYAHFEKLKILDEQLGIGNLLAWPAKVAMNVNFKTGGAKVENNALYSAQFDALLVVPYTEKALPLLINAGVMAHEHFHAIFQKLVIAPLKEKYPSLRKSLQQANVHDEDQRLKDMGLWEDHILDQRKIDNTPVSDDETFFRLLYSATLMRGINEGFADVWGWVYSGDTGFVGRSIVQEKMGRSLDTPLERLTSADEVYTQIKLYGQSDPYLIGNQLARAIKKFAVMYGQQRNLDLTQVRPMIARWLLATMAPLNKTYVEKFEAKTKLSPADVLEIFSQNVNDLSSSECFYFVKLAQQSDRSQAFAQRCKSIRDGGR